jgi:phage terminase large subunit-like protein
MVEIAMVTRNLSESVKTVDALMKERRIHHDGDPVFASCIGNVVGHYDAKENVYPRKERPESKIDLAVALYMAMSRWLVRGDDEVATESPIFFA